MRPAKVVRLGEEFLKDINEGELVSMQAMEKDYKVKAMLQAGTRSGLRSDFEPDSHRLIPHGATFLARKLLILSAIIA